MPLGTMVGLGPGNILLHEDTVPPQGAQPQNFGQCLLWPNGWMDQDATSYKGRPRPRSHCVTWEPSSPPKMGTAPIFGRCLLWPNGRLFLLLMSTCCDICDYFGQNLVAMAASVRPLQSDMSSLDWPTTKPRYM